MVSTSSRRRCAGRTNQCGWGARAGRSAAILGESNHSAGPTFRAPGRIGATRRRRPPASPQHANEGLWIDPRSRPRRPPLIDRLRSRMERSTNTGIPLARAGTVRCRRPCPSVWRCANAGSCNGSTLRRPACRARFFKRGHFTITVHQDDEILPRLGSSITSVLTTTCSSTPRARDETAVPPCAS